MDTDSIILDYSYGSLFYLSSPSENNFLCNIVNFPNYPNQTFNINLFININENKSYSDNLSISNDLSINTNIIDPIFTNGYITDPSASYVKQEFTIMNDNSGNILKVFTNIISYDTSNNLFTNVGMVGGIIKTDIIPLKDNTINLGSSTSRFKEIWVYDIHTAPFTLYIGNASISSIDNKITLS